MSTTERRHMGALAWITRSQKLRPYGAAEQFVLVMKDEAKNEMSSGIPHMRQAENARQTYGIPGGGRHVNSEGHQETLQETLKRELAEELNDYNQSLAQGLSVLSEEEVVRLLYPFLVAQWRTSQKLIDLIPAVAVVHQFDALPAEVRAEADTIQKAEMGLSHAWVQLTYLNDLYKDLQRAPHDSRISNWLYRPQVLTAAHLYYLEYVAQLPAAVVVRECIENNKAIYGFAQDYSSTHTEWHINNGALRPDGTLNFPQLSEDDIVYLMGEKKNNVHK